MRKIAIMGVIIVGLIAFVSSADASFFRGEINADYSYEDLEIVIEGKKKKKCHLKGTIVNETDERKEDVKITFYALNIHGETLWKATAKIDLVKRYGKIGFDALMKGTSVKRCKNEEPYKWKFKVKEPKKTELSEKTFPRGEINENYLYENLKLERVKKGKKQTCHLKGTIINKTGERREDVKITFYARTLYDKTLWKQAIKIDVIDGYGKADFEKRLKRCRKEDPYKWEFKVKEKRRR